MKSTRAVQFWLAACLLAFGTFTRAHAAEVIPPRPEKYFNDYAGVVAPNTAAQLNRELEQFERDTSNQIVVAIFPRMQSDSSIEDYTVRVFQAWQVGQKQRNNGAVLFIFSQDRKLRIVTGYGLEGALPDALCKQIIEDEITPRFRTGDFNAGVAAGARAMMAAARGEYRGTGRTAADRNNRSSSSSGAFSFLPFIVFIVIFALIARRRRRNTVFGRRGVWVDRTPWWGAGGGWGGGSSGGGWSGGSSGGGFSGGGGSTGGGGAGGSW
jgi:uncharacterized protein